MNAIVAGREGQWRINKEEEKKNNDERGGGGASSISVKFCSCVCACACFGVVGCLCCCHHGTPALGEIPFLVALLFLDLFGTSQMMSAEQSVPTPRKKMASPTECTFSQTCTLSAPDLVVRSVWLVVTRAFAVVVIR